MGKNKKHQQQKSAPKPVVQTKVENFTDDQVSEIENKVTELTSGMPDSMPEIEQDQTPLPYDDASHLEQLASNGNVTQYLNYLEKKVRIINAKERELNAEKERVAALKEQNEKDKKKNDEDKSLILKDRQKIQEERDAIDNGEYSTVIRQLLNSLNDSKKKVYDDTQSLIDSLTTKHSEYLNKVEQLFAEQQKLEDRVLEIDKLNRQLSIERKKFEYEQKALRSRIESELRGEFEGEIQDLNDKLDFANNGIRTLTAEKERLLQFKKTITASFHGTDVESMLQDYKDLKAKYEALMEQNEDRHTEEDFQEEVEKVRILTEKVNELKSKFSEQRLNELRQSLQNADAFILEINTYKARIDSAEAREQTLRRTVDDLRKTIELLREDQRAKEGAFEFARRLDDNAELQNRRPRYHTPDNLAEFAEYIQKHMASGSKPFYYSMKTVQTFIAGLHMSPLSILWGISGTGKTSLPREFAKAIVANSEGYTGQDEAGNNLEPYRICAIQSGWRDNMDLIGFYNNFDKRYNETDFFRAIYLASQPKYSDTLFFIILDEMNLSRPEHYFADFLSLMEQPEYSRNITIKAPLEVMPKLAKDGMIKLPANVRFIGTANHDETTLSFAPKTYDRSNVIELKPVTEKERSTIKSTTSSYTVGYTWLQKQFIEAEKANKDYCKTFDEFIKDKKLTDMLAEVGIGVGLRFEDQARRFISVYIATGRDKDECLSEAADHLITSRLFRTIPNRRLDFSTSQLQDLRDGYEALFKKYFGDKPASGLELLDNVIGFEE